MSRFSVDKAGEFVLRPRRFADGPARAVSVAFGAGIAVGTGLLMLPAARTGHGGAGFLEALFTATSALCVTGLSTVDPATHWTTFGQAIILGLIQVGGLGIMTLASLLAIVVAKRLGLRTLLTAASESNTLAIGDVREVLVGVIKMTALIEAVVAVALTLRFCLGYGESIGRSLWLGCYHAISAFNNAGFALWSDSLISFAGDPWVLLPLCAAVIAGGLGLPVLVELRRRIRTPRAWSLHVKLTVWGSAVLLVGGFVAITLLEWRNPATLGSHGYGTRLLVGFTQAVMPRSAGFNAWDYADVEDPTLFVSSILNFIGGGSASTAGGIKVGTFFLLFFAIVAECRGVQDVEISGRRIGLRTMRQALTVALASVSVVVTSTLLLLILEPINLNRALFESTSAFATSGLTAGVTATLSEPSQILLIVLMFIGRIGPMTLVMALALRERPHLYRYPEGRPLVG